MVEFPNVSIIIPARNEESYIERCLDACLSQTYPSDKIEVVVVDGMSEDRTREIVKKYLEVNQNVKLIDNPKRIAPAAMNIGIKESKGDVVVRVDGHAVIDKEYVKSCIDKLREDDGIWAVGGPIETIGETKVARAISFAMSSVFGVGNSYFRTVKEKEMFVDTVPFPASPRWIYDIVGLYDEEFVRNQDDEHNLRIIEKGGKILLSPKIKSQYFSRSNFKSVLKQYFQYGFYKVRVMQKHPKIFRIRHFVPGIFVFCLLCSPFLFFIPYGRLLSYSLYFSYIFSNLFFSFYTCLKNKFWGLFHLSLAFLCLHLGYGSGFICGLIHFNFRRKNGK